MFRYATIPLLCLLVFLPSSRLAQDKPETPEPESATIQLTECLVLPSVGKYGRSPVHIDALEALILEGKFSNPKPGDAVVNSDGESIAWQSATAGDDGWIRGDDYRGANAFWVVPSDKEQTVLLHARGHSWVYANGIPHAGDPYGFGYVRTPVRLKKGDNTFLFGMGRGSLKAELQLLGDAPPRLVFGRDWTLPDLVVGQQPAKQMFGAVDVINTTESTLEIVPLVVGVSPLKMNERYTGVRVSVPAMSCRKVEVPIPVQGEVINAEYEYELSMIEPKGESIHLDNSLATTSFTVKVVDPTQARRVTFRSDIDGSVQYYGLRPAVPLGNDSAKPGIVLSLHGAGVEGIGQARAYSPKSWCHIVCPTNRRPFGFDWEDWGRLDALEVLAHAKSTLEHDPTKVWLTGHSMGGHGTWTVGAHFPDKFAAVAPSAGWESFFSYVSGSTFPEQYSISELLTRSTNPSRTLLHKYNYKSQGVYILHGDADDNVPVTEARRMRDELKQFHTDLQYFEQPGAGHWWDDGHDDGADCLDWQPIFDMFAHRRLPQMNEVQSVDFTTVCPEHSASSHWARIEMQEKQLAPSRIQIQLFPNKGRFEGTTENVTRLRLQLDGVITQRESVSIQLDSQELGECAWPTDGALTLRMSEGKWQAEASASLKLKGPHRCGWLKNGMNHRFVLVYGTNGSAAENEWSFNKARFDAEQWWYRGNGAVEVVADKDFRAAAYPDRGVVLYGNRVTNLAFDLLIQGSPVEAKPKQAVIGDKAVVRGDLAMLYTYPRVDSDLASVVVVGGTGIKGMRLTDRVAYFTSGASFPDVLVFGPEMLKDGTGGLLVGGYFSEDWEVSGGDWVWNKTIK
ncbi:MAG: prolyl oligopeptidase family serine peptidase [Planctomycetes bacterium]|nr:prolyl oligopeptidase family serine peptidase [Planctomycetota bacterium]